MLDTFLSLAGLGLTYVGGIKTDQNFNNIIDRLRSLELKVEKISDRIWYCPDLKEVSSVSYSARTATSIREIRKDLEILADFLNRPLLSTAVITTSEKMQEVFKVKPSQMLDQISTIKRLTPHSNPQMVPILFKDRGELMVGWQMKGILPQLFQIEYNPILTIQDSHFPSKKKVENKTDFLFPVEVRKLLPVKVPKANSEFIEIKNISENDQKLSVSFDFKVDTYNIRRLKDVMQKNFLSLEIELFTNNHFPRSLEKISDQMKKISDQIQEEKIEIQNLRDNLEANKKAGYYVLCCFLMNWKKQYKFFFCNHSVESSTQQITSASPSSIIYLKTNEETLPFTLMKSRYSLNKEYYLEKKCGSYSGFPGSGKIVFDLNKIEKKHPLFYSSIAYKPFDLNIKNFLKEWFSLNHLVKGWKGFINFELYYCFDDFTHVWNHDRTSNKIIPVTQYACIARSNIESWKLQK